MRAILEAFVQQLAADPRLSRASEDAAKAATAAPISRGKLHDTKQAISGPAVAGAQLRERPPRIQESRGKGAAFGVRSGPSRPGIRPRRRWRRRDTVHPGPRQ